MDLIKSSGRRLRRLAQGQETSDKDVHRSGSLKARGIGTGGALEPCDENMASAMDASGIAGSLVHVSMTTYSENERGLMPDHLATLRAEDRVLAAMQTFPPPPTYRFTSQHLPKPVMDEQLPIDAPPNLSSNQLKSDIDVIDIDLNAVLRGSAQQREGDAESEARGEHDVASASCGRHKRSGNYERPSRMVLLDELYSTMAVGQNRRPRSPMHSNGSTLSQVQTSQPEILDGEMMQIDNSNQATTMPCHPGPPRDIISPLHDRIESESPTLKSSSSIKDILVRERDKQQRPVTQTYTSSQDDIALAYPVRHATTPSSEKKAEKHTSAPFPPPTKPLPKVPAAANLRSQSPTHDMSSEALPKAIISCEDSPTLGLYRRHIRQPRSREHLLSISRDHNSASKYEGEASTYVKRTLVTPAPKVRPEHAFPPPAQSCNENSHHAQSLSCSEKADAGITNHQGRYPSPNTTDTRINVTLPGERVGCSNNRRQSSSQSVRWMVDHHSAKAVPSGTDEGSETPSLGSSVETEQLQRQSLAQYHGTARKSNSEHAIEGMSFYNQRLVAIYPNTQRDGDGSHREVVRSLQDRVSMLERQNQNLQAYILETLGLGSI